MLVLEGKVANDEFSGGMRISAEKLYDLETARGRYARGLRIRCNGQSSGSKLRELLSPYRSGQCPVTLVYTNKGASCEIQLGDQWRVSLKDELIDALGEWVRPENVDVVYRDVVQ